MNTAQYRRWLADQIEFLRGLGEWQNPDDRPQEILEEAYQIAIDLNLPECAAACKPPATIGLMAALKAIPDGKTVLTPPEIGEQLATAPETVVGWIRSGQLKGSNLATADRPRYVVQPEDLARFLASRQPQPPAKREPKPKRKYSRFSED